MKMYDNRCTILVNSCDKYEEAWLPFFTLLKKNWSNCNYEWVLNTEKKQFYSEYNVRSVNSSTNSWGDRMFEVLEQIDTPYVICLLEDFFLQKEVKTEEIERCIKLMDNDPNIAVFYFSKITGYTTISDKYPNYIHMNADENSSLYMFNCQAALWRKDVLKQSVIGNNTPWEYEDFGYQKVNSSVKKMDYYCSKESYYDAIREDDVFSYLLVRGLGYGIYQSKWLWKNKKLFRKEKISCSCNTLPTMTRRQYLFERYKEIVKRRLGKIIRS